ncbi:hypothetical protein TIFTF001_016651 [Ficus carica]|uniref:Uncharacterized protein n=1 Tax=Ficus carica TaxID=3494 RepID=A0AA88A0R6_FICCA|nr:hypothetical protein TIFTF001_016651 [Ficus carica]
MAAVVGREGGEEGGGGRREMQSIVCNHRYSRPSLCRDFISATVVVLVPASVANRPPSRIHPGHRCDLVPASEYLQWSQRNGNGTVSDQSGSPVMARNAGEGARSDVTSSPSARRAARSPSRVGLRWRVVIWWVTREAGELLMWAMGWWAVDR